MSPLSKADAATKASFLAEIESRQRLHEFPPQVVIETTAACNLACSHCGHASMTRPKGHMSMPLFRRIVDEVWPTFYGEAFILE